MVSPIQPSDLEKIGQVSDFLQNSLKKIDQSYETISNIIKETSKEELGKIISQAQIEIEKTENEIKKLDQGEVPDDIIYEKVNPTITIELKNVLNTYFKEFKIVMDNLESDGSIVYEVPFNSATITMLDVKTKTITKQNLPYINHIAPSVTQINDNELLIAGGIAYGNFQARDTAILLNLSSLTPITLPTTLNFARGYHTAHKIENSVFIFGGSNSDSFNAQPVQPIERYDINTQTFTVVSQLINSRSCCGSCVYKRKIYLTGGWGNERSIEVYDPNQNTITMLAISLNYPGTSLSVPMKNCILIISGNHVSKFYPERDRITEYGVVEAHNMGYFSIGTPACYDGKIYMYRAWNNGLWYYDYLANKIEPLPL
ncbi:unnamed protein product [Blepharisma stoltei]|uniref:Kelch repeat protein n=1 Tax=Blepharisma stoltei TaxID=1481888 RepID=A0AAU9JFV4_9CILI|nr:unnamed protein product [Blepharisma stoltei]